MKAGDCERSPGYRELSAASPAESTSVPPAQRGSTCCQGGGAWRLPGRRLHFREMVVRWVTVRQEEHWRRAKRPGGLTGLVSQRPYGSPGDDGRRGGYGQRLRAGYRAFHRLSSACSLLFLSVGRTSSALVLRHGSLCSGLWRLAPVFPFLHLETVGDGLPLLHHSPRGGASRRRRCQGSCAGDACPGRDGRARVASRLSPAPRGGMRRGLWEDRNSSLRRFGRRAGLVLWSLRRAGWHLSLLPTLPGHPNAALYA